MRIPMIRQVLLALAIVLLLAPEVAAQDTSGFHTAFKLGVYGGFAMNQHDTRANVFDGGSECGAFSSGTGTGPAAGIVGEFPLMGRWLDLYVSAVYAQRGGAFNEAITGGLPILDPNSDQYVDLVRRHDYTANLGYAFGEFGVRTRPIPGFDLFLRLTASLGLPLTTSYVQTETIQEPDGVVYPETNERTREVSSGRIVDVDMLSGLSGALGYDIPIGDRLTVAPEVSYHYTFGDVTPHYRWRINTITGGVAVKWAFGSYPPEPEPAPAPPPIVEHAPSPPPAPRVRLATVPPDRLHIVQTVVTETFPVLPYIFFDSASAEIPARYNRSRPGAPFDESRLPHHSLAAYYDILDIVGSRMATSDSGTITLNGTTDGREDEASAKDLARERAASIRDYLVDRWKVDPARITVTTSQRPAFPSSAEYTEGLEENRRVEISASTPSLLLPLVFERFNEYEFSPKSLGFTSESDRRGEVTGWRLRVSADGTTVHGAGGDESVPENHEWKLDESSIEAIAGALAADDSLHAVMTVDDAHGQHSSAETSIPVSIEQNPFEVSRLSLVVFDFDRSEISEPNRRMVSSFVASSIHPASTSTITGSTDRLGELAHNMELSESRAQAVRTLILAERSDANILDTRGIGSSKLDYDNALPEGRYYCRTVTVEVKTPVTEMSAK